MGDAGEPRRVGRVASSKMYGEELAGKVKRRWPTREAIFIPRDHRLNQGGNGQERTGTHLGLEHTATTDFTLSGEDGVVACAGSFHAVIPVVNDVQAPVFKGLFDISEAWRHDYLARLAHPDCRLVRSLRE